MKEIFVFGSNRQGRHGAGAARKAFLDCGAEYGQAEGLQGSSYAIVTKELRKTHDPVTLEDIYDGVQRFLLFACAHPEMKFKVTPIGCGLAGFRPEDIKPFFHDAPENVVLPKAFK